MRRSQKTVRFTAEEVSLMVLLLSVTEADAACRPYAAHEHDRIKAVLYKCKAAAQGDQTGIRSNADFIEIV